MADESWANWGFKTFIFDYEQVYNDPLSLSSAIEIAGIIPVGKILKAVKVLSKAAGAVKGVEKAVESAKDVEKLTSDLKKAEKGVNKAKSCKSKVSCPPKKKKSEKSPEQRRLDKERKKGVDEAWKQERELVENTGQGSREWTPDEMKELLETGKVKGYEGHHINSVNKFPEMAANPNNIKFVRGRDGHLLEHRGNFRNPTQGPVIRRK